MVEARGVEPLSESDSAELSPGAGGISALRRFPCPAADRQAGRSGSFIIHGALKALRAHVHH